MFLHLDLEKENNFLSVVIKRNSNVSSLSQLTCNGL